MDSQYEMLCFRMANDYLLIPCHSHLSVAYPCFIKSDRTAETGKQVPSPKKAAGAAPGQTEVKLLFLPKLHIFGLVCFHFINFHVLLPLLSRMLVEIDHAVYHSLLHGFFVEICLPP